MISKLRIVFFLMVLELNSLLKNKLIFISWKFSGYEFQVDLNQVHNDILLVNMCIKN